MIIVVLKMIVLMWGSYYLNVWGRLYEAWIAYAVDKS